MKYVYLVCERVMSFWLNNKSLKKSFKNGKVIGVTFRDIDYGKLIADEEFQTYLKDAEANGVSIKHRGAGDRYKVWDEDAKTMVTKIVQADYVYVGLDMRATYDSVDDMFTAPK